MVVQHLTLLLQVSTATPTATDVLLLLFDLYSNYHEWKRRSTTEYYQQYYCELCYNPPTNSFPNSDPVTGKRRRTFLPA